MGNDSDLFSRFREPQDSGDPLIDILHPPVPPLPPPLDSEDLHHLAIARQYAIRSIDPLNRSGCVIVRAGRILSGSCDQFPGAVQSTMARRRDRHIRSGMLLSAEQSALAMAAGAGAALQSSSAYVWPMFTDALSVALLIQAGCVVLNTPDYAAPGRLQQQCALIREMAAEAGVLLRTIDPEAIEQMDRELVRPS